MAKSSPGQQLQANLKWHSRKELTPRLWANSVETSGQVNLWWKRMCKKIKATMAVWEILEGLTGEQGFWPPHNSGWWKQNNEPPVQAATKFNYSYILVGSCINKKEGRGLGGWLGGVFSNFSRQPNCSPVTPQPGPAPVLALACQTWANFMLQPTRKKAENKSRLYIPLIFYL